MFQKLQKEGSAPCRTPLTSPVPAASSPGPMYPTTTVMWTIAIPLGSWENSSLLCAFCQDAEEKFIPFSLFLAVGKTVSDIVY